MQGRRQGGPQRPAMRAEAVPANPMEFCPACGHRTEDGEHRCQKCGRRLIAPTGSVPVEVRGGNRESKLRVVSPTPGTGRSGSRSPQEPTSRRMATRPRAPAFPEPLRRQLSAQVREFRTRRLRPGLPFPPGEESPEPEKVVSITEPDAPPERTKADRKPDRRARHSRTPSQPQSPLAFPDSETGALDVEFSTPPVASFRVRLLADCLDCALILAAVAVFLAPLPLLAGEVVWNRYAVAGGLAIGCAVALLYGVVFVYLAGATPAMRRMGLRLVNFDGQPASRPERLWRLLGAVASAGSFLLGFVWAAMDDERFSWHDRISRTFLTALTPEDR